LGTVEINSILLYIYIYRLYIPKSAYKQTWSIFCGKYTY